MMLASRHLTAACCVGLGGGKIESTTFGAITIDGKTYEHHVVVRLSGEIVKRKRNYSRSCMVPRTCFQKTRQDFSSRRGDQIVIGRQRAPVTGSRSLFRKKGLRGPAEADAWAIEMLNRSRARRIGPNDVLKSGQGCSVKAQSDTVCVGETEGRNDSRYLPYCR
jgi:hypothetical protein